jgi:hypothetical protein
MPETTLVPQPPPECCHCDEHSFAPCSQAADYTTYYRGVEVAFCEKHYLAWIVGPLLRGEIAEGDVSPVAPGEVVI